MLIACATDRRYVEMTGVLIRSIAAQAHASVPEIVVFCSDLRRRDKYRLEQCARGGAQVTLFDIPSDMREEIEGLPVRRHLSVTAYASLFIPKVLGDRSRRLLYLDCDIVVNTCLDPLFAANLGGRSVAAVQDEAAPTRIRDLNNAIGQAPDAPYFNSGVVLVDLPAWNQRSVTQRALDYARHRPEPILQHDQAVLNYVLKDDWTPLPARWNATPTKSPAELAREMPLQHFWGRSKPFYSDYPLEYRALYDRYRAETPWANAFRVRPIRRTLDKRRREIANGIERIRSILTRRPSDG